MHVAEALGRGHRSELAVSHRVPGFEGFEGELGPALMPPLNGSSVSFELGMTDSVPVPRAVQHKRAQHRTSDSCIDMQASSVQLAVTSLRHVVQVLQIQVGGTTISSVVRREPAVHGTDGS